MLSVITAIVFMLSVVVLSVILQSDAIDCGSVVKSEEINRNK
jgi:hypothetical protein